ncbi:MAG: hypothetical protein EON55_04840 [Alphaproteobacteria bacterium]|nr:MAG: hypothetical protein EON55_04840 [Alphaproteobacteria bacterium]
MTEPSGPDDVLSFWPAWTRTLDAMIRNLARVRSRCRQCRTLLHVDPEALYCRFGGTASLINRSDACTVVGCSGTVYYLGAPATGAAYHVLIDRPALLDGVVDPLGLPFRSRWHGMVSVGSVPIPFPASAYVVELSHRLSAERRLELPGSERR